MLTLREIQRVPEKHAGPVTIGGWAKTIRTGKSVGFIELNDGTCFKSVQVVFPNDERNMGKDLSTGCSVRVTGQMVLTPDAPQPFEIQADSITLEGACPPDFPMQKKRHTLEYLRTQQTLRPRTNTFLAVFRVRSVVSAAMGGIRLLFRDLCIYLSGTGVRANLIEPAEAADTDDPQHTAQLALSVAGNPLFCGCEIRTDAAHFHQK